MTKKILFTISLATLGVIVLAMPALAATVLVSPTAINVAANQNFNLSLSVDPQGGKDYTAKIELKFPADLLEVNSFTMASGWMPLTQTGYDLIDNANGSLIKTGGYPGGLSSSASFGAVSFKAKKSGSGTISLGGASLILDATNKNILTGSPSANVIIAVAPTATPKPLIAPQGTTTISPSPVVSGSPAPMPIETIVAESPTVSPSTAPTGEGFSLLASVGNFFSLGTNSAAVVIIVILLILALIYIAWDYFARHKKQQ